MENENLYETDYYGWLEQQRDLLLDKKFDQLDLDRLIEEIDDMGRSEIHALESHMVILLLHLLKYDHQQKVLQDPWVEDKVLHTWMASINNPRSEIGVLLRKSPHLKGKVESALADAYPHARKDAIQELNQHIRTEGKKLNNKSLPEECPWSAEQVLDKSWLP